MGNTTLNRVLIQDRNAPTGIAARLRSFIRFRRQSLRAFAKETGIPYRTLQGYLAGDRRPGADHLVNMAAVGLDVGWLLTGRLPYRYQRTPGSADDAGDVIGADARFLELVERQALVATDQYMDRRRERGLAPLTASGTLIAFGYYMQLMISAAAKLPKDIVDLHFHKIGISVLVDMLSHSITPDLDLKIDQIIETETRAVPGPDRPHGGATDGR